MDQSDPGPGQTIGEVGKRRQREAVNHRQGARRQLPDRLRSRGTRHLVGLRKAARKLMHLDAPAERTQALHDAPVVDVAAGPLVERSRHDEMQRRRHQA